MFWQAKYNYPPIPDIISWDRVCLWEMLPHIVDINKTPKNLNYRKFNLLFTHGKGNIKAVNYKQETRSSYYSINKANF